MNDAELMRAYVREGSQEAFETLVNRYVRLVYAACWRQLRDRHEAEDATQAVFLLLSQNAASIRQDRAAGWLLTAARYACANIRRSQQRRERREQVVAMGEAHNADSTQEKDLAALLDAGLGHLGATDREALVLRYLREQSFEEVGRALGISPEAARKRVDRGVDKLRRHFQRQGITAHSAAVSALLTSQLGNTGLTQEGLQQMVQGVLHVARAGGQASASSVAIAKGTKTMMWMSKMKAAALIGAMALAVGGSGWALTAALTEKDIKGQLAAATGSDAKPGQTAEALDLSTPEEAMKSFCRSLMAGDRQQAYACLTSDPKRKPTALDAWLAWDLAENRLIRAARKVFGEDADQMRTGMTFEEVAKMFGDAREGGAGTSATEGDNASMQVEVPAFVIATLPQQAQDIVKQWSGKPMRFHKANGQWKLDLDHSMRVEVTLMDEHMQKIPVDAQRPVTILMEIAKITDETAQGLDQGTWKTLGTARGVMNEKRGQLSQKYKFSDLVIQALPAEASKNP